MIKRCRHCGSPYSQSKGYGDYCCSGCEHVYYLIQDGGLENFYALQDRAGRPIGDTPFEKLDSVSIKKLQRQVESESGCRVTVRIKGMSCMGCAWLIEHLCGRHRGVLHSKAELSAGCLSISWEPGEFDLSVLARELHNFGYTIDGDGVSAGFSMSPLAIRCGLTLIFCLNGLLLFTAAMLGLGSYQLQQLYVLLISGCLLFSQFIGGSIFFVPAWRGLLMRRLHVDLLSASILFVLFGLAFVSLFIAAFPMEYVVVYFISLSMFIAFRWLSVLKALRLANKNAS